MLTRIVVGVVAALFAVGMLAIRFTPVFPIVVAFFAVMAAFELERVIGVKNKAIHIISLIFAGLIPLYYGFNHYLTERGIFYSRACRSNTLHTAFVHSYDNRLRAYKV